MTASDKSTSGGGRPDGRLHGLFSESKLGREQRVGAKLDAKQCLSLEFEPDIDHGDGEDGAQRPAGAIGDMVLSSTDEALFEGIG